MLVVGGVYIACVADVDYKCSLGGMEYIISENFDDLVQPRRQRLTWGYNQPNAATSIMSIIRTAHSGQTVPGILSLIF